MVRRFCSFVALVLVQSVADSSGDIFSTSPYHKLLDDLRQLAERYPEDAYLKELNRRGVDFVVTENGKPTPNLRTWISGRGFHRELHCELTDVPSGSAVDILVWQPMKADVFVDPYQLNGLTTLKTNSVSTSVRGKIDLESPSTSVEPTLLSIMATRPEGGDVDWVIPFHARYPPAATPMQSAPCQRDSQHRRWPGVYLCIELDPPVAVIDYGDDGAFGIVLLSEARGMIEIPAGNALHFAIVHVFSLLTLIVSFCAVLWAILWGRSRDSVSDRKTR